MSFLADWSRSLATDDRLSPTDILVGRTLALWMDKDGGRCFPTHARVAFYAGLTTETVRKCIRRLRTLHFLLRESRSAPGRAATYRAVIPEVPADHLRVMETEHRDRGTGVESGDNSEHRDRGPGVGDEHRDDETEHRYHGPKTPVPRSRPTVHQLSISTAADNALEHFRYAWPTSLGLSEDQVRDGASRAFPDDPELQDRAVEDWRQRQGRGRVVTALAESIRYLAEKHRAVAVGGGGAMTFVRDRPPTRTVEKNRPRP